MPCPPTSAAPQNTHSSQDHAAMPLSQGRCLLPLPGRDVPCRCRPKWMCTARFFRRFVLPFSVENFTPTRRTHDAPAENLDKQTAISRHLNPPSAQFLLDTNEPLAKKLISFKTKPTNDFYSIQMDGLLRTNQRLTRHTGGPFRGNFQSPTQAIRNRRKPQKTNASATSQSPTFTYFRTANPRPRSFDSLSRPD
jgi:hypothetical protein